MGKRLNTGSATMDSALAAILRNNCSLACYWAKRGYIVNFTVQRVSNGKGGHEFLVTSDMVNGLPRDMAAQRTLEEKVAA
jgi:hypothetical protein